MEQLLSKYKFQFIAILVALGMGAGVGYYFSSNQANKEIKKLTEEHVKELKKRTDSYIQDIDNNLKTIKSLQEEVATNTIKVKAMEDKIKKSDSLINKRRLDATKLTSDEKAKFLLDRYTNK